MGVPEMKNELRIALVLGAALGLSACASVTRGTKQTFQVLSEPSGASVAMSNGQTCVTPCKLKLPRKTEFTADVALPGYKPGRAQVNSTVGAGGIGSTAGNILLGGIIGIAVDGASGAMQNLSPNPLKWVMAPDGSAEETKVVPAGKPKAPRKPASSSRKRTAAAEGTPPSS